MTATAPHTHDQAQRRPLATLVRPSLPAPVFRGRIGSSAARGFYPAPHRYEVYLRGHCPDALRVFVTLGLLGLREEVPVTVLGTPGVAPAAEAGLRHAYEAARHRYEGPLSVPALCDRWSGRVVSNHAPDILRDLTDRFPSPACGDGTCGSGLRPACRTADIDRLESLLHPLPEESGHACFRAALDELDRRLADSPYVWGEAPTASDVDAWAALLWPAAGYGSELRATLEEHPGRRRLLSYVERLSSRPEFRAALEAGLGPR
ncbi:glutathione S-transferase C-terminal domain-containing protein [Streptomyces sp. NPDC007088]|uniref:glutathione S-transferase C-terminal domain-containing protein n=1 Tax=Streptomyces sp. NPDC007088 TaxID=3364773 RepID=UPI0036902B90